MEGPLEGAPRPVRSPGAGGPQPPAACPATGTASFRAAPGPTLLFYPRPPS